MPAPAAPEIRRDPHVVHDAVVDYPPLAKRNGITGKVRVRIHIDENGVPTQVEILESNPKSIFDRAAKEKAMKTTWESTGRAYIGEADIRFDLKNQ